MLCGVSFFPSITVQQHRTPYDFSKWTAGLDWLGLDWLACFGGKSFILECFTIFLTSAVSSTIGVEEHILPPKKCFSNDRVHLNAKLSECHSFLATRFFFLYTQAVGLFIAVHFHFSSSVSFFWLRYYYRYIELLKGLGTS